MTICTVHEQLNPPADRLDRAERLLFVEDGFSWLAAFLTPLWMLANRMWRALLLYLAGVFAFALTLHGLGVTAEWSQLATLALHVAIGFEADSLQRWTLARSGWRMLGAVTGPSLEECERRFLERWLPDQPIIAATSLAPSADARPSRRHGWFASRF